MSDYAEMIAASTFSFLHGASQPSDLVLTALLLHHSGIGIADRNSVAGVVRAWSTLEEIRENGRPAAQKIKQGDSPGEFGWHEPTFDGDDLGALATRFKLAVGARLVFADTTPDIVVYPANRSGWGRLCRLLTIGNCRAEKGDCVLHLGDLLADTGDLLLIVTPGRQKLDAALLPELAVAAPGAVWLAATMHRRGDDRRRLVGLQAHADAAKIPLLAVNDALYADAGQRDLQDVLTCIREGCTIAQAGRRLEANAERHLKTTEEMRRLFVDAPDAIAETQRLLGRIDFTLDQIRYEYPDEPIPPGWQPQAWLEELTWQCAVRHYSAGIPAKVAKVLTDELALIATVDYAPYFLTIHDIVSFANGRGILCQGRGSAANSAVCFVLGITSVDPAEHDLLFARFISIERREPPDIDVDFEHERREEVIQYVYEKYGRHRAGIIATVIRYRPRSAIRDVGKIFGLDEDIIARLAGTQWGSWGSDLPDQHIREAGLDPNSPAIRRAVNFATRLIGFPRHLSQHVGGFVLARERLDEIVPVGNAAMVDRTFIEWDKDDIDALGMMKVDVLALGMLTCIKKGFDLLREHDGVAMGLADVPGEQADVYDMLCKGDSLGVFQVESRAQMNMLPRLKPRTFYDLVIEVAIVRPGPIQGDMVHPYLRRRSGKEQVIYPAPAPPHDPDELRQVLGRTLGVPLFQEQAMRLAMVAARFTDAEANRLRRAMATFRNVGTIGELESLMIERMVERGYERDFAERCFGQIKGFGSYGFPESHAASFAKLVYISSYLKCRHPAIFACALLNSQPMGFYAPAQIVRDAQAHDVEIRPIDINHSDWDNTLERRPDGALALRLGFRQINEFRRAEAQRLVAARGIGFPGIEELAVRARLYGRPMRLLADADACRSLGLPRREALWAVRRLPSAEPLPLFAAADARELADEPAASLPVMALAEQVITDYQVTRLSLKGHPLGLLRPQLRAENIATAVEITARPDGARASVAGVVLVRQRPGNGRAIFLTLEDETGVANIILWADTFEEYRHIILSARLLVADGTVQQNPDGVCHLMAVRLHDRTADLDRIADPNRRGATAPASRGMHPRDVRILPKSRDFH